MDSSQPSYSPATVSSSGQATYYATPMSYVLGNEICCVMLDLQMQHESAKTDNKKITRSICSVAYTRVHPHFHQVNIIYCMISASLGILGHRDQTEAKFLSLGSDCKDCRPLLTARCSIVCFNDLKYSLIL